MANTTNISGHKPLDNLAYDLVTVLHAKAKGLEAMDRYMNDAQNDEEARQLLERIRREDEQQIEQIKRCVVRCLESESGGQGMTQGSPKGSQAGTRSGPSKSGAV